MYNPLSSERVTYNQGWCDVVVQKFSFPFQVFQNKFDLDFELPLVFIDTHYNISNIEEADAYKRETDKLWKVSLNRKPFQCLTRKDVQDKLKKEKEDLVAMKRKCRLTNKQNNEMTVKVRTQEKQIQAQRFVMNNLRNGIDYLKEHCKRDTADSKLFFMQ